ncbi:MAG: isoleucine--tRNA ligase [Flavobacteriales bacterium]|nr:isoleucine--tRNA ligase [Flavobacteriales bacterium]MCB9365281.1 isoleucine--tRNA ligase [Flavobacteriales bacterium]
MSQYKVYKGLDLPNVAKEVLDKWEKQQVFEKSISTREGNKPFVFYEGPPSANGLPGIHHVMARAIKDIFCRYKTLKGFQVKRKAGWDTHGLPVELSVEKKLGITKEDIGKKISVDEYNKECRETVMQYTDIWNDLTEKMGYWVDMENPYITYENKYMESVWWLLGQLHQKNLLYKGYTIQPYSPAAGTGLSSHELNQPGCYRDVKDTTAVAQFKIKPGQDSPLSGELEGAYFIAWTTTPWTLPSNTALAVGPKIDYVLVKSFNQYTHQPISVVVAKPLLSKQFSGKYEESEDLNYTEGDKKIPFKVIAECKGTDLVGIQYEQLLPYAQPCAEAYPPTSGELEGAAPFQVIAGDFVTTEDGTGIVHIAPTFGQDDAQVAKDAGIPAMLVLDDNGNLVPLVDLQGKFRPEIKDGDFLFGGEFVKEEYLTEEEKEIEFKKQKEILESKGKIKDLKEYLNVDKRIVLKLQEEGKLFKKETYEHSYPHCWRTDKPVLYYPLDSWFVKSTALKQRMIELNKTINWKPESTGTGRFGNWLENLNDWNLSRSRYWGIPIPIWRTEEGDEEICISSVEQLKEEIEKSIAAGFMQTSPLADFVVGDMSAANYDKFDLHKNYVDEITLVSSTGKPMKREADLIDVWFDSGSMPYAQYHYPFEMPHLTSPKGRDEVSPRYVAYHQIKEESKKDAHKVLLNEVENKLKNTEGDFKRNYIIDELAVDFIELTSKTVIIVTNEQLISAYNFRKQILNDLGYNVVFISGNETIDALVAKIKHPEKLSPFGGVGGGFCPADFIAEGVDQTRGWFFTLHAIGTMVFDSVAYKNVVSNGLVLDKNGQKMSKRLGNAADPFETLGKYGADATRWYMITNAQPWDNLKFDLDGITEVQRKFFGTLYNTYGFFALYANLDGFTYAEEEVALEDRPEIDRWVISKLNSLIKTVDGFYADYEPTKAGRAIQDFVNDELSNWYVRLCRRRFWKGDYSQDKIAAYQTLYKCLEVVAQLSASIAPFYMDQLYTDLVAVSGKGNATSVHLSDFPVADKNAIDTDLEERMAIAQQVSSMVLSLRKKESLKVRQPLQKIMVPILSDKFKRQLEAVEDLILSETNVKELEYLMDTTGVLVKSIKPNFKTLGPKYGKIMKQIAAAVNQFGSDKITEIEAKGELEIEIEGQNVVLELADVEISTQDIPGWLVTTEKGTTVALDITISPELREEGIAREFVNRIQNLRKDSGLEVTDKIHLKILSHQEINNAVNNNKDYICSETLAGQLDLVEEFKQNEGLSVEIEENISTMISIEKLN